MIKNVIIACDYAYFEGGAANVALLTALSLSKYSEYKIICFAGCGETCDELKASNVEVIELGLPDLLGNPNRVKAMISGIYNRKVECKLKELLSKLNVQETILHIHTWTKVLTSAVFKVATDFGIKTFLTVHEYFLACPNGACFDYKKNEICERTPLSFSCIKCNCDARNYVQKIWRCIRQWVQNRVIRKNAEIKYIFISDFEKKQLLRRIPDIASSYMMKNPIRYTKRERIKAENNNLYLYIGRMSREKGIELFCEAVTRAHVEAMAIGGGILLEKLKEKYTNITFTGNLSKAEIDQHLKNVRALVFPSLWYEGSPLTVPEVQAYGIPCIVTDCSSAVDDVSDGFTGNVVSADLKKLTDIIKRYLKDDYVKFISMNTFNSFDEERGSEKIYTEKLIKIYEEE